VVRCYWRVTEASPRSYLEDSGRSDRYRPRMSVGRHDIPDWGNASTGVCCIPYDAVGISMHGKEEPAGGASQATARFGRTAYDLRFTCVGPISSGLLEIVQVTYRSRSRTSSIDLVLTTNE